MAKNDQNALAPLAFKEELKLAKVSCPHFPLTLPLSHGNCFPFLHTSFNILMIVYSFVLNMSD